MEVPFVKVAETEGETGWYEAGEFPRGLMASISFLKNSCSAELGASVP